MNRIPCVSCKAPILEGARKCRACKAWIPSAHTDPLAMGVGARPEPKFPRAALILTTAVAAVMAVIVSARESPVGEAPPLTALGAESASASAHVSAQADPSATDDAESEPAPPRSDRWRVVREIRIGDVHPLDLAWNPMGQSVYVSGDDATLREYRLKTGELIHQASVAAQGDFIRILFDCFIAVLRHQDAARIPVLDTAAWDRDPVLLDVGKSPGDIVELPDGKSVVAATTDGKRLTRFELPGGVRLANITLPHATGQLFLVRAEGRPYLAAMGALLHAGRPAGAWIDLFDPAEMPFGATRRSISVGREPMDGSVTRDGGAIFFPDRVANTATFLRIASTTDAKLVAVGQSPEAGYLLDGDRFGITINSVTRTASVVDLSTMTVSSTLMLDGTPRSGATSPDGQTLFVVLGGTEMPPKGSGVAVISGNPPKIVASLPTGEGAAAVAVSKDGTHAAVANYWDRSITVLER